MRSRRSCSASRSPRSRWCSTAAPSGVPRCACTSSRWRTWRCFSAPWSSTFTCRTGVRLVPYSRLSVAFSNRMVASTAPARLAEMPPDHMREMLGRLARHACKVADLDRACVFLRDQLSEVSMTVAAVHGLPQELVGQSFGIVDGMAGRVLLSGSPALVDGGAASSGAREHALGWTRGMVSVPVRWAGQVRAALAVGSSDPDRVIDERDL